MSFGHISSFLLFFVMFFYHFHTLFSGHLCKCKILFVAKLCGNSGPAEPGYALLCKQGRSRSVGS